MSTATFNTWLNPNGSENYKCRAWVNFNGVNNTIRASGNVSSVTVNGTGDYTVNFTTAMPDANYSAATSVDNDTATGNSTAFMPFPTTPFSTSSARFVIRLASGALANRTFCSVNIFR
jgi:hypothetical protein